MSFRSILSVVRERILLVILTPLVLAGLAVFISLLQTPQYEASIKVWVGQQEDASAPYSLGSDVQGLQQLTLTLAEVANSRPLADTVIERLDLDVTAEAFMTERLNVEPITDTQFIQIDYRDPDPKQAQRVANTIGEAFSSSVSRVSPDASGVTATVWETAVLPDEPVSPDPVRNGLLGLGAGLLVGLLLVYLLDYLDDSWRSPEEVEEVSGLPTFGVIPDFTRVKSEVSKSRKKGRD